MTKKALMLTFLALVIAAAPSRGQTAVDEKAEPVLRALAAYYRELPGFQVDLEAVTRLESEGLKQEFTSQARLTVRKPDRLALTVRNNLLSMVVACDGATLTTFLPSLNRYSVKPAPASLEAVAAELGTDSPACLPVIAALIEKDPYAAFLRQAAVIRYAGQEPQGGVPCHKLDFVHDGSICHAWIRKGPRPVLEAVKPSLSRLRQAGAVPADLHAEAFLRLTNWQTSASIPDSCFQIAIPPDALKTDTLIPGLAPVSGEPDGKKDAKPE